MCDISTCLEELGSGGPGPQQEVGRRVVGSQETLSPLLRVKIRVVSLVLVCRWLCEEEELLGVVMWVVCGGSWQPASCCCPVCTVQSAQPHSSTHDTVSPYTTPTPTPPTPSSPSSSYQSSTSGPSLLTTKQDTSVSLCLSPHWWLTLSVRQSVAGPPDWLTDSFPFLSTTNTQHGHIHHTPN